MNIKGKIGLLGGMLTASVLTAVATAIHIQDLATVRMAKEVDAVIGAFCRDTGTLPARNLIGSRFPALTTDTGWFFFGDDQSYLKVQYPMRWWNGAAIGKPQISEFTATVYSYVVSYDCKKTQ